MGLSEIRLGEMGLGEMGQNRRCRRLLIVVELITSDAVQRLQHGIVLCITTSRHLPFRPLSQP